MLLTDIQIYADGEYVASVKCTPENEDFIEEIIKPTENVKNLRTREEIIELVYFLNLQNTNGRESHDEMFKLGIEACYDSFSDSEIMLNRADKLNKGMGYAPPLCKDDLLNLDFEKMPHFTIGNTLIHKLGRHRQLSVSCVGTPNETLWITETDDQNEKRITNLVCLHNYDYDGYLTISKIKGLIDLITGSLR